MGERMLRGSRLGAVSYESDRNTELAPRQTREYLCARGHQFEVPFAVDAEVPITWECKFDGTVARLVDGSEPEQKKAKPPADPLGHAAGAALHRRARGHPQRAAGRGPHPSRPRLLTHTDTDARPGCEPGGRRHVWTQGLRAQWSSGSTISPSIGSPGAPVGPWVTWSVADGAGPLDEASYGRPGRARTRLGPNSDDTALGWDPVGEVALDQPAHQVAGGRQEQEQADDVGDEAWHQQQHPAGQAEHAVGRGVAGWAAGRPRPRGTPARRGRPPAGAASRPSPRWPAPAAASRPTADRVADHDEHRDLDRRDHDDEQRRSGPDGASGQRSLVTLAPVSRRLAGQPTFRKPLPAATCAAPDGDPPERLPDDGRAHLAGPAFPLDERDRYLDHPEPAAGTPARPGRPGSSSPARRPCRHPSCRVPASGRPGSRR